MSSIGVDITAETPPKAEIWVSATASLTSGAVFLVRSGRSKLFSRVCRASDMVNWPSSETDGFGWHRVEGIELPLEHCEDLKNYTDAISNAVQALDDTYELEPNTVETGHDLRYFRTGDTFGVLIANTQTYGDVLKITLSLSITEESLGLTLPEGLFVTSPFGESGYVLDRVIEIADGDDGENIASDESLESSITVWIPEDMEQALLQAIAGDIEDFCTYLAINNDLGIL